jgi:hypothetical protein
MRRSLIAAAVRAAATVAPAPASAFTARVTNPWLPLLAGMRRVYRGSEDGHHLREVVRVAHRVAMIDSVPVAEITLRGGNEQAALVSFTRG